MTHLTEEQLRQLRDGKLSADEREIILRHLGGCKACLDELNQWFEKQMVPLAMDEEIVVSDSFQPKLMRRINHEEAARATLQFSLANLFMVIIFLIHSIFAIGSKRPPSSR